MLYNLTSGIPDLKYAIEKIYRDARASRIEDGANCNLSLIAGNLIAQEAMG
jgi:hypothetical protein